MKIRKDFVTNSSSANYILSILLESDDGKRVVDNIAVSEETCGSLDGDLTAEDVSLCPSQRGDKIVFDTIPLKEMTDIDQLVDEMFRGATIIGLEPNMEDEDIGYRDTEGKKFYVDPDSVWDYYPSDEEIKEIVVDSAEKRLVYESYTEGYRSKGIVTDDIDEADIVVSNSRASSLNCDPGKIMSERMFVINFDEDTYYDREEEINEDVTCYDALPKTRKYFKEKCHRAGLNMDNLKQIQICNIKSGHGDSAMFFSGNVFAKYKDRYKQAKSDQEKQEVLNELVDYVLSEPEVYVSDNWGVDDGQWRICYDGSKESLTRMMKEYLENNSRFNDWITSKADMYIINVKNGTMENKERMLID